MSTLNKSSTPIRKRSSEAAGNYVINYNNNLTDSGHEDLLEVSEVCGASETPDSMNALTPTTNSSQDSCLMTLDSEQHSEQMGKLYESINEQKIVIMKCLDSDTCDINALNEQLEVLTTMQQKYSKLEYEQARNLWMAGLRHLAGDQAEPGSETEYETHFASLVEQEVERILFQEKVLKAESEFQEREMLKMERDRELAQLRRQHEREIYMLKRKLHETSINSRKISNNATGNLETLEDLSALTVNIPSFTLSGIGSHSHVEYQVDIKTLDCAWTVMRRFRQFRDLHMAMTSLYGPIITALPFPSRRLFGNRSSSVSGERQKQLCGYLNVLLLTLVKIESCPLYKNPTKNALLKLSAFFHQDAKEAVENNESILDQQDNALPSP
jgi:hypothetical protein